MVKIVKSRKSKVIPGLKARNLYSPGREPWENETKEGGLKDRHLSCAVTDYVGLSDLIMFLAYPGLTPWAIQIWRFQRYESREAI